MFAHRRLERLAGEFFDQVAEDIVAGAIGKGVAGLVIERRERRYRIAELLGQLAELAAEGKGMDAAEVRFQARMLPMVDQGT